VTVRGDATALLRAAVNLVENAVRYAPAGGLVQLTAGREDGRGVLSVRDSGPGIPPEHAARVFEPFVRLDASRDRDSGGAGLGLSIARSIVVAHGGALTLDSPPGGGALFTMRLPVAA
jgi:two-component system OmpR family sensor kinase